MDYHGTAGNDIIDQAKLGIANNSNIYGEAGDDTITIGFANAVGGPGNDTIIGTNGGSSAVYWDAPKGVSVDLQTGQTQDGFGNVDTLINIHSILGSGYSDTLLGGNGSDKFWGGRGDDYFDGRGGVNSVSFFFEPLSKFTIIYDSTTKLFTVANLDPNSQNYGTKTLANIQILQFSGDGSGDTSIPLSQYIANYTISFNGHDIPVSNAGTWKPVADATFLSKDYNGTIAGTFHGIIPLGTSGAYGIVVTGWGFSGWPPSLTAAAPVSMAILSQDVNGIFGVHTSDYISDTKTNGGGSVIVADFNADGKLDIFLAAHNESPFIAMPSTAYLSNSSGTFTKVNLTDHVMAHDAELAYINGKPVVLTGTFGPGDTNPIYSFVNGAFVKTIQPNLSQLLGMDTTLVDSGPTVGRQLIRGDVNSGYNPTTGYSATQDIVVYAFDGSDVSSLSPLQAITPYLSTLPQYKAFPAQIGGPGLTHTYRVWADDLNHDGKQDILAGESMWSETSNDFPSALQVLINKGDGTFKDATASLNPDMSLNISEMDYNPTFIDIDRSGINTYLFAGTGNVVRQSNFVLLNDGTGRLHVALHDQFNQLAPQVYGYLGLQFDTGATMPKFIGVPDADGSIDFVAEVSTSVLNATANIWQAAFDYVNVPLHFNPTTDFSQIVTVTDRNNSMLMRTWAGNDIFCDTNASISSTSIDGGLGIDTSSYSHTRQQYKVTHNGDGTWSVTQSGAIADTLKNIERLKFSDDSIALDVGATQSAGETQLLLGAVLGKDLLATKQPLIGAVIDLFDHAYTLQQLSGAVMRLPIWDALTGKAAPTNTDIANYLLWRVNGVTPDATALASAVNALYAQPDINHHQGDFLWHLAESSANQAQVGLVGLAATGLAFTV